jgi:chromosome segregation ATPase
MTVLEQLEEARARIRTLDAENTQLKNDVAALTTLADQLKQQNQNLAQLSDANVQSRAALDQEMDKVRTEQKSLEARCRTLADDLLGERIQRVRVERELILAKVKQAEGKEDGP